MTNLLFDLPPQPPAPATHNLFLAAVPPPETAEMIKHSWQRHGTTDSFRARTLHATILSLGIAEEIDPRVIGALSGVCNELIFPEFPLRLDRVRTYPQRSGNNAIVLEAPDSAPELSQLANALQRLFVRNRIPVGKAKSGTPHVTMAYGRGFPDIRMLPEPLIWQLREIVLIDSVQGEGRHVILGRWPLQPPLTQKPLD